MLEWEEDDVACSVRDDDGDPSVVDEELLAEVAPDLMELLRNNSAGPGAAKVALVACTQSSSQQLHSPRFDM